MKNHTYTVASIDQLPTIAQQFVDAVSLPCIICFQGDMGVGKTTFIKAIIGVLTCEEDGNSPTYSVINEHFSTRYGSVFHLDLYRIQNVEEALDLGIEEILYTNRIALIEWPEVIRNLLPPNHVWVTLQQDETSQQRIISMSV